MKILIIRFSSIGDLTQALSIPSLIKHYDTKAEIHFVTRKDLVSLLEFHPQIDRTWSLDRKKGLRGLLKLIKTLKLENYTHIYDAHNNLRSFFIRHFVNASFKIVKPMNRFKRLMLIRFQKNYFEKPFSGQRDLLKPLEKWGFSYFLPPPPQLFLKQSDLDFASTLMKTKGLTKFSVLVPSATYLLKRWPLKHWQRLIELNPNEKFVILAGVADLFTSELNIFPNVLNLTGQTSLLESAAIIKQARAVVTNDTGLLHFAEQLGKPTIALMGPAPFGFPSRLTTKILEKNLACRPCSKHGQGPCVNVKFQECLVSINPDEVSYELNRMLDLIR